MASSSHSNRRAMASSEEGDETVANARKKPRIRMPPENSYSEDEIEQSHGHSEEDGGEGEDEEEDEEQEESQTEDDDGDEQEEEQEEQEESQTEDDDDGDKQEEEEQQEHTDPAAATRAVVAGVTVYDAYALDCGICFVPLRPPIFQYEVGHVVCSHCRDMLALMAVPKCHVCGSVDNGGYRRCHAMERLADAIHVACPHAAHGCAATPAYHELESHRDTCTHAPCHCPGKACYNDLAAGLPDPKQSFQFVVPRYVVGDDEESGVGISNSKRNATSRITRPGGRLLLLPI
uniref:RING-type E3 ubiquitin transferase n=1 Tax=Leersia perrieri TaxID=77586 RepID=A0A0D9WCX9_9ORYZ